MIRFVPLNSVAGVLFNLLELVVIAILVELMASFAQMFGARPISRRNRFWQVIMAITIPVLKPFRIIQDAVLNGLTRQSRRSGHRSLGAIRQFDFSPLLAILTIQWLQMQLFR